MYDILIVKYKEEPDSVYCGRGSFFGNPWPITQFENRDFVCDRFQEDFDEQVRINPVHLEELLKLHKLGKEKGSLKLGCFCAPARCHTETIKRFLINNQVLLESLI